MSSLSDKENDTRRIAQENLAAGIETSGDVASRAAVPLETAERWAEQVRWR